MRNKSALWIVFVASAFLMLRSAMGACEGGGGGGGSPAGGNKGGGGAPVAGGGKGAGGAGAGVKVIGGGGVLINFPNFTHSVSETIKWTYLDDAKNSAKSNKQAYAIYFYHGPSGMLAGEGKQAIENYRKANGYTPISTIFEKELVLEAFAEAHLNYFVKMALSQSDPDLLRKYGPQPNTLVICTPDGEALTKFVAEECNQTNVVNYFKRGFVDSFNAWEARVAKAQPKAAPAPAAPQGPVVQAPARVAAPPAVPVAVPKAIAEVQPAKKSNIQTMSLPGLKTAYRFSGKVVAGSIPDTNDALRALKSISIRTVISVDGSAPDASFFETAGLRCVHIPVRYDGVKEEQALALAKAVRDLPTPLYVFSADETHRAAAAAAVALTTLGEMQPADAAAAIDGAQVPQNLNNLRASVKSAIKVDGWFLDASDVKLVSSVETGWMTQSMAQLGEDWNVLENAETEGWRAPQDSRGRDLHRSARRVLEAYNAMHKANELKAFQKEFSDKMSAGSTTSGELVQTIEKWKDDSENFELKAKVRAAFQQASASCVNCHTQHRNGK